MIKDLFLNISLLTFFILIFTRVQYRLHKTIATFYPITVGMIHGCLGSVLVYFGIPVYENNIMDFRQLAILSAAFFGGLPATITAGFLIITFRFFSFGINSGSLTALLIISINAIISGVIAKKIKHYWLKWTTMIGFLIIISSTTIVLQHFIKATPLYPIMPLFEGFLLAGGFFIALLIDMLNRSQETRDALLESENRYRMLIETSPDGICVIRDEIIIFANENASRLLGGKAKITLEGMSPFEFIDDSRIKEIRNVFESILKCTDKVIKTQNSYTRLDGNIIELDCTSTKIDFEGKPSIMVIFRDITEQKLSERKLTEANTLLQKLSLTDALTGLANRRYFDERFEIQRNDAIQNDIPLTIAMFDIDYFKSFNDAFGHLEGDHCLQALANEIERNLHRSGDFLARYGGEEFIAIFSETEEQAAWDKANKIRKSIENLKIPSANSAVSQYVTVSIGVVSMKPSSDHMSELIENADKALYQAKTEGKNRVVLFELARTNDFFTN